MGQSDVLNILEEKKIWMTVAEVREILDISTSSIDRVLNILFRSGEIFKKQTYVGSRRINIWKGK